MSGEAVAFLEGHEGKTAKDLKSDVAAQSGISRFRQKLWSEDWSHEIPDDEVFTAEEVKMQLVLSEFWQPESEQDARMIAASELMTRRHLKKCFSALEIPILGMRGVGPHRFKIYAAANGHVEPMRLLLEAGAEKEGPRHESSRLDSVAYSNFGRGLRCFVARIWITGSDADLATLDLGGSPLHLAAQNGHVDFFSVVDCCGC